MHRIDEYLQEQQITVENTQEEFASIMKLLKRFKMIDQDTIIFEIGIGSGWFQILCAMNGIACRGLELSAPLVDHAQQYAKKYGVEIDVDIGSIEHADIGTARYDIVIANSVFEHVKDWQKGLEQIFTVLRPGGLLYFSSTNKFSFTSGEYDFPLYGWWPDSWRYRLRRARQGDDIMEYGIDFHQFTYFQLRRFFRKLGFTQVFDLVDILDPDHLNHPTLRKKLLLRTLKSFGPVKHLALVFAPGTHFVCIK